jgi:hypothetical protein
MKTSRGLSRGLSFHTSFPSSRTSSSSLLASPTSKKSKKKRHVVQPCEDQILLDRIQSMSLDERQKLAEEVLHGSFVDMDHFISNHKESRRRSSAEEEKVGSSSPRRRRQMKSAQHHSMSQSMASLPIGNDLYDEPSLLVPERRGSSSGVSPKKKKEILRSPSRSKNETLMSPRRNPKKKKGSWMSPSPSDKKETLMSPRSRKELPPPSPRKELPPPSPRKPPKKPPGSRLQRSLSALFSSSNSSLQIEDVLPVSAECITEGEGSSQILQFSSSCASLQLEDISHVLPVRH